MDAPTPVTPDEILAALDPEQRQVASAPLGAMRVLAGAGTGKTRAITHRIAYGVASGAYPPNRVLAVTFTARAAGEMRTRLRALGVAGVQARTFHAAALRQLQYFWPKAVGGAAPQVQPIKAPLVAEAGSRLRLTMDRTLVRDAAAEIEWAKVTGASAATYPAAAAAARRTSAGLDPTTMSRLLTTYEEVKTARGVIDFEDVLLLTVGILAARGDIAEQVRDQYRHFVVDEYQDVNGAQQRLLDLWRGDRDDLCVVGDPAQTIYSFTGASGVHLLDFTARHPRADTVRLIRNYRSSAAVVHLANALLHQGAGAVSGAGPASPPPADLVSAGGSAGPVPTLTAYPDDVAEAEAVAAAIGAAIAGGTAPARIAVLFRTNAQSGAVETALAAADIPYQVRGGERFFQRDEVRRALVLLRGAARGDDGSVPLGHLVRDVLTGVGWSATAPAGAAARERWESLTALSVLADEFAATSPEARLPDLVRELDERAAASHAPTVQGVTLASLHAAKGLEWDDVTLIGCSEGLLPISMADTPAQIEEERRLLYVGVTRARHRLTLTWALARQAGGRATRRPSPFLATLPGAVLADRSRAASRGGAGGREDGAGRRGGRRAARTPARCRGCGADLPTAAQRKVGRCATCPPSYDEATFEALRTWRITVATRDSVPAYVVFTDATLTAIAEARPADERGLAAISGVGPRKLGLYGDQVLAVLGGADPVGAAAAPDPADEPG